MGQFDQARPGTLIALAATGPFLGAILGGLTNGISCWLSPSYFRNMMRWHDVYDIWTASIAQGIFEGILFGLGFSVVFVVVVGIVTKARCPYRLAAPYLVWMAVAALVCWLLGGLIAIGLVSLSPEFYEHAFVGARDSEPFPQMIRGAWVGGSIVGLKCGGLVAVIVGSVLFRAKWQLLTQEPAKPGASKPGS